MAKLKGLKINSSKSVVLNKIDQNKENLNLKNSKLDRQIMRLEMYKSTFVGKKIIPNKRSVAIETPLTSLTGNIFKPPEN